MQLDATSMESHPVSPHPDQLRTSTGGLFHPASMIQKSNIYQIEANACFKNNKYKEAIDLFAQAIESNPNDPVNFCNRALVHIKMENYGQALEDAGAALALNNGYAKAYYRRATAQLALGKFKPALADFRAVARLRPSDPEVIAKMRQCENIVRRQAFEAAIRGDESVSPFTTIDLDQMAVPADYDGPRWEEEELTAEWVETMTEWLKAGKVLHRKYAYKMLGRAKDLLSKLPNIVEVEIPEGTEMTVCGDTHGQFYDLLNIFSINGRPSPSNPYVFNGDFVDRGSWSVEVILTLLSYKVLYPDSMHLTRGNHETTNMNKLYGFEGEVMFKYSRHMYDCYTELFCHLPLAVTLNNKVLVCHGGLFRDDRVSLDDVRRVNRVCEPPEEGILCDLLWSDPQDGPGRNASKRGTGCMFGPDVTEKWLTDNGLELLVRSHEMKEAGYEVQHNGRCITVFSAPNYCDIMANLGAFIRFGQACRPAFTQFAAVPHPPLRPMHYSPMGLKGLTAPGPPGPPGEAAAGGIPEGSDD